MFFQQPNIKLIFKITEKMTLEDATSFLTANMTEIFHNNNFWKNTFDADNFEHFKSRYDALAKYPLLQNGIKCGKDTFRDAERTIEILQYDNEQRAQALLTPDQATKVPFIFRFLLRDNGIIALREGLITLDQAEKMPTVEHLLNLLSNNGIIALGEGLITPEQAASMPDEDYLSKINLLSDNGIDALRERLITVDQARSMRTAGFLNSLFSENGMAALREELITIDQVARMQGSISLFILFCDNKNGINALRKGLIPHAQLEQGLSYMDAMKIALHHEREPVVEPVMEPPMKGCSIS